MKQSKLFTKTKKEAKEYESKNATYLIKAGYIDQVMSGVYSFLPLGMRVLHKIEQIVREEMDKIGQEVVMPAISPRQNWEATDRLGIDVLLQVTGANEASTAQNDANYILNPTHEDIVTPMVQQFSNSYRDLPIAVYQIQNKFRNEARPKSGLFRGREFRMKDLYSFHGSKEDLMEYYETAKQAYVTVFERLGIGDQTFIALASGGDFTDNYSHEFQTKCELGEDTIFFDTVNSIYYNREVAASQAPQVSYQDTEMQKMEDVLGEGIIGVEELAEFLSIPVEKTTKTILLNADEEYFIAAAVRGGYDVDEGKLKKVLGAKMLRMATEAEVKQVTGTVPGYVGILNLPADVKLIVDESCDNRVNFETGANRKDYHTINANWGRDIQKPGQFYDIKVAKAGDINPETGEVYEVFAAAEVGNIFPLETKFSDAFDFTYLDEGGKPQIVYMGSYGIGTTRAMGVIAELMSDDKGLMWPIQIAPFHVHLIPIAKSEDDEIAQKANEVYEQLTDAGIEVLLDDRYNKRPGEKFADADLLGIPYRVVIGKEFKQNGKVELKQRSASETQLVDINEIIEQIKLN